MLFRPIFLFTFCLARFKPAGSMGTLYFYPTWMVDFLWYIIYRMIYLPVPWILWDHEMVYLPIWMVDFFMVFMKGNIYILVPWIRHGKETHLKKQKKTPKNQPPRIKKLSHSFWGLRVDVFPKSHDQRKRLQKGAWNSAGNRGWSSMFPNIFRCILYYNILYTSALILQSVWMYVLAWNHRIPTGRFIFLLLTGHSWWPMFKEAISKVIP